MTEFEQAILDNLEAIQVDVLRVVHPELGPALAKIRLLQHRVEDLERIAALWAEEAKRLGSQGITT